MSFSLDLAPDEEKIYLTLLAMGNSSIGEIIQYSGLPYETVATNIENLMQKQLIHRLEGIPSRYVAIYPFKLFAEAAQGSVERMQALVSELTTKVQENLSAIQQKLKEDQTTIENAFTKTEEDVKKTNSEVLQKLEAASQKIETVETEKKTQLNQDVNALLDAQLKEVQNKHSTLQQQLGEKRAEAENQFQQELTNLKNEFNQIVTNFSTQKSTAVEQTTQTLKNNLQQIRNRTDQFITTTKNQHLLVVDQLKSGVATFAQDTTQFLQEKVLRMHENIKANLQSVYAGFDSLAQRHLEQVNKAIEAFQDVESTKFGYLTTKITTNQRDIVNKKIEMISQETEKSLNTLSEFVNQTKQQFNELVETLSSNLQRFLNNTQSSIISELKSFSEEISTLSEKIAQDHTDIIRETTAKLTQDVATANSETKNAALEKKQEHEKNIEMTIHAFQDETEERLKSQNAQLEELVQGFKDKLETQISQVQEAAQSYYTQLEESIANSQQRLNELIDTAAKDLSTAHTELFNRFTTQFSTLVQSLEKMVTSFSNDIDMAQKSFTDSIANNTLAKYAETLEEIKRAFNDVKISLRDAQNEYVQLVLSYSQNLKDTVKAGLQSQVSTLESNLNTLSNNFTAIVTETQKLLETHHNSLKTFEERLIGYKRPPVTTATLYGRTAVFKHIENMFSRIKSGMVLFIPNFSDVPINLLKSVDTRRRIKLYTQVDPTSQRDLLKQLLNAGNIEIYNLDPSMQGVQSLLGNIIAELAGEEVLMAVEEGNDAFGIVSQQESFIKLVGATIMNDIQALTSRGKIKLSDLT